MMIRALMLAAALLAALMGPPCAVASLSTLDRDLAWSCSLGPASDPDCPASGGPSDCCQSGCCHAVFALVPPLWSDGPTAVTTIAAAPEPIRPATAAKPSPSARSPPPG